jgi:hypothetical protein
MNNGIAGLRGYQQGGLVEDDPGWFARMRQRNAERQRQSSQPAPSQARIPFFGLGRMPLFAKQFAGDIAGNFLRDELGMERFGDFVGSGEINAPDLGGDEFRALQESVLRALERGGPNASLTYDDYGLDDLADYISVAAPGVVPQKMQGEVESRRAEHEQALRDQGYTQQHIDELYAQGPFGRFKSAQVLKDLEGGQGPLEALLSSPAAFSLAGTIGSGQIRKDPETGEYWVHDEYDFNDAANLPEDASFWADAAKEGFLPTPGNVYGQARNLGKHYGSQPGEGSSVRINLGTLEHLYGDPKPREEGPSMLAGAMRWLRELRGGNPTAAPVPQLALASAGIPAEDDQAGYLEGLKRKAEHNQQILEAMSRGVPGSVGVGVGSDDYR